MQLHQIAVKGSHILFKVSAEENDGEKILQSLSEVAETSVQADIEKEMVNILQGLHGPWSFIYWQVRFQTYPEGED